jgi:hypothetical protein
MSTLPACQLSTRRHSTTGEPEQCATERKPLHGTIYRFNAPPPSCSKKLQQGSVIPTAAATCNGVRSKFWTVNAQRKEVHRIDTDARACAES